MPTQNEPERIAEICVAMQQKNADASLIASSKPTPIRFIGGALKSKNVLLKVQLNGATMFGRNTIGNFIFRN